MRGDKVCNKQQVNQYDSVLGHKFVSRSCDELFGALGFRLGVETKLKLRLCVGKA